MINSKYFPNVNALFCFLAALCIGLQCVFVVFFNHFKKQQMSCQPRVPVMSCFAYKVIRDLESKDHSPQDRINTKVICRFPLAHVNCTS